MNTSIKKWGNSQGIRIPKTLLDLLNWKINEKIQISISDDYIIIKKSRRSRPRKTIEERFADFDGEYYSEEVDWGEPVGREVW